MRKPRQKQSWCAATGLRFRSTSPSAARFGFDDLCAKPLGAADYLTLAKLYPTIFIDHVPHLDFSKRNEAKRFIILIDVLYDFGSRIFITAADAPDDIYSVKAGLKVGEFSPHLVTAHRNGE